MAHVRVVEIGILQIRALQIRIRHFRAAEIDLRKTRANQIRGLVSTAISIGAQIDARHICAFEAGAAQDRSTHLGIDKTAVLENSAPQRGPIKNGLVELGPPERAVPKRGRGENRSRHVQLGRLNAFDGGTGDIQTGLRVA